MLMKTTPTIKPYSTDTSHSNTITLFRNPILEKLSRTHISVPLLLYYSISSALLYYGISQQILDVFSTIGFFLIGFFGFTLFEYTVHRYAFHLKPDTPLKQKLQYNFHGVHHDFPKDKDRLVMPPVVSILLASLLFGLFKIIMGNYVFAFLPGFLSGYASYLGIHYAVHSFVPPKNFLKVLWIHHSIHHYKDHTRAFGVSSPLWDYVFGTMPKK